MKAITVKKSPVADTRTCDYTKVTKEELLVASKQHIDDVKNGLRFLAVGLSVAADAHDRTKISEIDQFHADFKTGFEKTSWWEKHQDVERHHFNSLEYIQDVINLLDVIEQIVDGVMAGMARSGAYRYEPLSDSLLQKAYNNTAKLLLENIEVTE